MPRNILPVNKREVTSDRDDPALKLPGMHHQDCQGIQGARPPLGRKRRKIWQGIRTNRLLMLIVIMFFGSMVFSQRDGPDHEQSGCS